MSHVFRLFAVATFILSFPSSLLFSQQNVSQAASMNKRPLNVDDLFALGRVGAPSISADGKSTVYAVSEITDSKNNKSVSRIWIVPTDGSNANEP